MSKYPNWEEYEDEILYKFYKDSKKEDILKLLPRRNWSSITIRGAKIGVYRLNYFSESEIEYIKDNFSEMSIKEISEVLKRHPGNVCSKAVKMGLVKKPKWTEEDDLIIRENISEKDARAIQEEDFPDRSLSSIYHRIQWLGLQVPKKRFTNISNDEMIKRLRETAESIGRTPNEKELHSLGLPSTAVIYKRFGSYSEMCSLANIEINFGITKRQTSISDSGHKCLSNAERKITDFLFSKNIVFEKEIPYSEIIQNDDFSRKYICDWLLFDGTLVEYFGIPRKESYKKKMQEKIAICKEYKISMICILEKQLNSLEEIFSNYI